MAIKRIMVVDDEEKTRRSISILLSEAGYLVEEAADGHEAWEKLEANTNGKPPTDLLLTDIFMPRMTGLELIRTLRPKLPSLPVLVISGYADDWMHGLLNEIGRAELIAKPFGARALLAKVEEALAS